MKKKCVRMAASILAAVLMLAGTLTVSASAMECSICLRLPDLNTTFDGMEVAVYQVGKLKDPEDALKLQVFEPVEGLEEMESVFVADELNKADVARKTAEKLTGMVDSMEGITVQRKAVGDDGTVEFDSLEPGIYLVKQSSGENSYGRMQAFLAVLPYMDAETGELRGELEAEAKAEKPAVTPDEPDTEKDPETPSESGTEEEPVKPQKETTQETQTEETISGPEGSGGGMSPGSGTGDESAWALWGVLAAVSAAAVAFIIVRKKSH